MAISCRISAQICKLVTKESSEDAILPIEYSPMRSSTSRCTVKINWTNRYKNTRMRDKLNMNWRYLKLAH